jgi:diguanylate cyclase (GGDEF)-like protein
MLKAKKFLVTFSLGICIFLAGSVRGNDVRALDSPYTAEPFQNARFEHLAVEDGLPHATVLSVLQDQMGFMWFTTADGLSRYDGYTFTTFKHDTQNPNSLSNNNTFALLESRDGLIWVGTDPGGLNVYDPKTGTFSLYLHDPNDPASLADNSIWSLWEDQDGSIWVGTRGGLSRLDRATGKFKNYYPDPGNPRALADGVIYRIYQDRHGTIWAGTRLGLHRFDPATDDFTIFKNNPDDPDSLSSSSVWAMLEDSRGNFWVGTRGGGLNLFDRSTGKFKAYKYDENDPTSISDNRLWFIYEDHSGNLWVTTENGGLNLFDPQTEKFTSFKHNPNDLYSLSNNDVFWMTEDRSGVLWVTSRYGGVNMLSPSQHRFGLYRSIPGDSTSLSSNSVYAILSEGDVVWVGTFGGGLNRLDRKTGEMTVYVNGLDDPSSLSNNKIYYVFQDESKMLWVATSGGGLNRLDPQTGTFTVYRSSTDVPGSLSSNFLTTIESAGKGRLWIGTLGYGLDLFDTVTGKLIQHYRHEDGNPNSLSEDTIYDLAVNADGDVWIATARGGLDLLDPRTDTFTHHQNKPDNPNSILSDTVHAIYLDEESGTVWAGTAGGLSGLNIASGEWQNYTMREGLPNDTIMGIQPDGIGGVWVSTSKGISHFDIRNKTFRNYDARDGLQGDQFQIASSSLGPDGEIFFGGSNGLTYFHTTGIGENPYLPPVVFTEFQIFNKTVPVGSEVLPRPVEQMDRLVLRYDQSVFTIKFAALSYQAPSKNRYQYMLEGFDRDWSPPLTRPEATYTNLSPGLYTFRVRAANNDGVWSETSSKLVIEIAPPWWGTWWFSLLAALAIVALVAGGVQLRISSIRTTNRELEKRVNGRTKELQDAQERLSIANAELQKQLDEITQLEKKVREQAIRDALTGLYNRHHLSDVLDTEFSRAQRKGHSIAFILADLDHFKQINDKYGHHVGDLVLKEAARIIREKTRRSDSAFRYGGEEFLLILPEITTEEAVARAEQLCQDIHLLDISHEEKTVHVHTSIGVAVYPRHGQNSDEMLIRADKALYRAKGAGGNQVVLYSPEE